MLWSLNRVPRYTPSMCVKCRVDHIYGVHCRYFLPQSSFKSSVTNLEIVDFAISQLGSCTRLALRSRQFSALNHRETRPIQASWPSFHSLRSWDCVRPFTGRIGLISLQNTCDEEGRRMASAWSVLLGIMDLESPIFTSPTRWTQ